MKQYATSIGLDVHARSIAACAFDPMTGEVTRTSFPYDPAVFSQVPFSEMCKHFFRVWARSF
ncbi:MAG: hypothetical protein II128_04090, partial [Atopobiaceae bacterium]|nr:hypothetical protein [Atopobiaceae bacterium]